MIEHIARFGVTADGLWNQTDIIEYAYYLHEHTNLEPEKIVSYLTGLAHWNRREWLRDEEMIKNGNISQLAIDLFEAIR